MRRSPESLVARLRNRKGRIVTYSILSVTCLVMLVFHWLLATRMMTDLVPKSGDDLVLSAILGQPMVVGIACLQTMGFLFALGLGAASGALIAVLTGATRSDLLVQLWDRVEALEGKNNHVGQQNS